MTDMHDRVSRSRSVIALEGWPWLIGAAIVVVIGLRLGWHQLAGVATLFGIALALLFRDPARVVPPLPAAVYAPVDGRVAAVAEAPGDDGGRDWWRVRIRIRHAGAYTVRAPIEGTILEIGERAVVGDQRNGLCVRSEEGGHVMLAFPGRGWLRRPRAFVRYGERLGQGERFAFLRLAPLADVYLPRSARLRVAAGDRVLAGDTVLADLITG
jgi:phosphatidylserine decarboxylase